MMQRAKHAEPSFLPTQAQQLLVSCATQKVSSCSYRSGDHVAGLLLLSFV